MGHAQKPLSSRLADRTFELKSEIHRKLPRGLNMERVNSIPMDRVRTGIGRVVERLLEVERVPMTTAGQNRLVEEVLDVVLGLGPLEELLKDSTISDILVTKLDKVYIERNGKLQLTSIHFRDNAHLLHIIEKIAAQMGRRVDEAQPIVDARLRDGSRVNAIVPPLALDGPARSHERRNDPVADNVPGNAAIPGLVRTGEGKHSDLGRDWLRQDDQVKCPVAVRSGGGADHHNRGHGRTAVTAAARGEVRHPPFEFKQRGWNQSTAIAANGVAPEAGPHHHR